MIASLFRALLWLLALGVTLWSIGAIYYDLPWAHLRQPFAIAYGAVLVLCLWRLRGWRKFAFALGAFALVVTWWLQITPGHQQPWQPDVAQTAYGEINGQQITLHNVRHCDYRSEFDYTPRWTTRRFDLGQIRAIDLAITNWGIPFIAHTILSFEIEGQPPLAISIETRKQVGQEYSTIAGFYRQFELIYVVSDERDLLRLRTNYRKGETVYLYRIHASPKHAQRIFMQYFGHINRLHHQPEFYNALTSNCTTNIRTHAVATERHPTPWDWRILLNGYLDELLYQRHELVGSGTLAELRARAVINPAAQSIGDAPDFSRQIREIIGFPTSPTLATGQIEP